jgi:outer membrane receptor protein involved in Fe transport
VRIRQASFVAGTLALACFTASLAHAQATGNFDLPEQPLADSLRALAAQTHTNILFDRELVAHVSAKPIKAELSLTQALERLLEGTGLTFRSSDDKTVLIVSARQTRNGKADEYFPDGAELEEVIVTAQKREERLQDVPSSVSVLSSKQMLDSHQTRLVDYAATIPGLQVESAAPGRSTLTLRGLALHGDGATVGTYIDDVPFGSSAGGRTMALELLPYDLERIEVLRGPQGTFYGANALGGLLKYVTKAPDLSQRQLSAGADLLDVRGAADAGYTVRASGNVPLIEGKLGLRASYGREHAPGYLDIPELNRHDVNDSTSQTGYLATLWQATDRLSVKLAGLVQQIDSPDNVLVRLDLAGKRPVFGDLRGVSALAQPFKQTLQLYSATLKYELGGFELTSVSSFANTLTELTTDATTTYGPVLEALTGGAVSAPLAPLDFKLDFSKYTQELRLATPPGGRLEGIVGLFYTHEENAPARQAIEALASDGTPIPGLSPLVAVDTPTTYEEGAVFGSLTYKITQRFDVSAGVRLARNEQELSSRVTGPLFPATDTRGRSSESVFNYSVAPRFRLNDDAMIYLRVATGYRPGGPNSVLNPQEGIPTEFKSDRIINYEAGVKTSLLEERVTFNVAAFQIDWQDVQIGLIDFTTGTGYFDNGKAARSRGLEWESVFMPTSGLRLGLTATWIDAKLTEDLPENSTLTGSSGDRLPAAPRFSGAATVNYRLPISAQWTAAAGATYRYAGSFLTGLSRDPNTLEVDDYSTVDLNFGAANDSWSINVFVRNVADKRAYIQENLLSDLATNQPLAIDGAVLQPRTIGVSFDKRFYP